MISETAADRVGFQHAALVYGSQEDFLAAAVPFLEEGISAGEPAVLLLDPLTARSVRRALSQPSAVSFLDQTRYSNPARAVREFRDTVSTQLADGGSQVRVLAEMSPLGSGNTWEWWARYEAAVNEACVDLPIASTCCYDSRVLTDDVLDDVVRAHPYLVGDGGDRAANVRYEEPGRFLRGRSPAHGADPVESAPALVTLTDPTPHAARRAVREVAGRARLEPTEVEGFLLAVSEAVTNAICHGRPPTRLRLWSVPGRLVATVSDRGPGPRDPCVGMQPTKDTTSGGLGLWMAHQMCGHLTLGYDDDGFTVRIITGRSH